MSKGNLFWNLRLQLKGLSTCDCLKQAENDRSHEGFMEIILKILLRISGSQKVSVIFMKMNRVINQGPYLLCNTCHLNGIHVVSSFTYLSTWHVWRSQKVNKNLDLICLICLFGQKFRRQFSIQANFLY